MTVADMVGRTFTKVIGQIGGEDLRFDGTPSVLFYHQQNCCETVTIVDICGDLSDLEGSPILVAESVSSENYPPTDEFNPSYGGSYTWTFYRFSTVKGSVTVRWFGESNGYYSESVDVKLVD